MLELPQVLQCNDLSTSLFSSSHLQTHFAVDVESSDVDIVESFDDMHLKEPLLVRRDIIRLALFRPC